MADRKKISPDFKNRVKRDNAEVILLLLSGLSTIEELRQKIRSIRCTYNQEVDKVKKSMGTGTGVSDVYTPKIVWFSLADSFLRQSLQENDPNESNLELAGQPLEANKVDENTTEENEEPMQLLTDKKQSRRDS
ncbi:hypothetical protein FQR65_LT07829 [Abscondita terminalis]|nr:hypothetical protein FQR65_LT07829 [Abscondita terminalis]